MTHLPFCFSQYLRHRFRDQPEIPFSNPHPHSVRNAPQSRQCVSEPSQYGVEHENVLRKSDDRFSCLHRNILGTPITHLPSSTLRPDIVSPIRDTSWSISSRSCSRPQRSPQPLGVGFRLHFSHSQGRWFCVGLKYAFRHM